MTPRRSRPLALRLAVTLRGRWLRARWRLPYQHDDLGARPLLHDVGDARPGVRVPLADVAQAPARLAVDPDDGEEVLAGGVEQAPEGVPVIAPVEIVTVCPSGTRLRRSPPP